MNYCLPKELKWPKILIRLWIVKVDLQSNYRYFLLRLTRNLSFGAGRSRYWLYLRVSGKCSTSNLQFIMINFLARGAPWKTKGNEIVRIHCVTQRQNSLSYTSASLTLYSVRSICIFSILFFIHFQKHWQGEFVWQSKYSLVDAYFLNSHEFFAWFSKEARIIRGEISCLSLL